MLSSVSGLTTGSSYTPADTAFSTGYLLDSPSGGPVEGDTVSLSEQAQAILEVVAQLSAFEKNWQASTADGSIADTYTKFGQTVSFTAQGITSATASGSEFEGRSLQYLTLNDNSDANGVVNVGINVASSTANALFEGSLNVGSGNDTITATSNTSLTIGVGNGNDNITATETGTGIFDFTQVYLGTGNDTVSLNGVSDVMGSGSGNDVVNLNTAGASAWAKADTTIVNGNGLAGESAVAFSGSTTINDIGDVRIDGGTSTVNLDNQAYSQVQLNPGDYSTTINLSDPASGVSDDSQPVALNIAGKQGGSAVAADADGNYSGSASDYLDVVPTQGQDGYGLAHTKLYFAGSAADQVTSTLQGSTLTLTVANTKASITINNYQPGRVTFVFDSGAVNSDQITATRQPPGLSS